MWGTGLIGCVVKHAPGMELRGMISAKQLPAVPYPPLHPQSSPNGAQTITNFEIITHQLNTLYYTPNIHLLGNIILHYIFSYIFLLTSKYVVK
jgi:hypothetical protein